MSTVLRRADPPKVNGDIAQRARAAAISPSKQARPAVRRRWTRIGAGITLTVFGAWVAAALYLSAGDRTEVVVLANPVSRFETIERVDVIAGPGNPWVQAAKLMVSGQVGIDMVAGPSEAMIVADEDANPDYIAADILAQCEHGYDSAGVLVTTSMKIAEDTLAAIMTQLKTLDRGNYLDKSLSQYSALIVVDTEREMLDLVNLYAPEHLEIQLADPMAFFAKVKNAGSCFIGDDSPVAAGDYATGTNHTLPTGTATRYASAVSPETFMKTIQYQRLTNDGLKRLLPIVEHVSDAEGLDAHKRSVQIRFESGTQS